MAPLAAFAAPASERGPVLYVAMALVPIGLAAIVYAFVGEVPDPAGLQFIGGATATCGALTWVVYRALWPDTKERERADQALRRSLDDGGPVIVDAPTDEDPGPRPS